MLESGGTVRAGKCGPCSPGPYALQGDRYQIDDRPLNELNTKVINPDMERC